MRCFVCNNEVEEGSAACGKCGFPMIVPLGASEEVIAQIRGKAQMYRESICRDIEIGFCAYTHRIVKDSTGAEKLECAHADNVPIGTCGSIPAGRVLWYPEKFVRPHSWDLDCSYYIKKGSSPASLKPLRIRLQQGSGDIQIGICQVGTGVIRFCVGSETEGYGQSGDIDVLE